MAQYTPNLGLIKPDGSDNVAIQQLNANMDVLDQQVHENTEKIDRTRIVYPPYIDENTGHWMIYDLDTGDYADSGYSAIGRPATFTARATTLPAGSDATASMSGTAENPVLNIGVPTGATGATGPTGAAAGFGTPTASVDGNTGTPGVTVTASGPNTAKVFDFKFRNLKGATGDPTSATAQTIKMSPTDNTTIAEAIAGAGKVASVNGKTGAVQLNDEDIPSTAVSGTDTVEGALGSLSQQIDDLGPYNGLDSDSISAALSAAQGKALKTLLDKLNSYELLVNYIDTYETRRIIYRTGNVIVALMRNINQSMQMPSGSLAIPYVIPEKYRPKHEIALMGTSQNGMVFNFGISEAGAVNGWLYASGTPGQMFAMVTWSVPLSSLN